MTQWHLQLEPHLVDILWLWLWRIWDLSPIASNFVFLPLWLLFHLWGLTSHHQGVRATGERSKASAWICGEGPVSQAWKSNRWISLNSSQKLFVAFAGMMYPAYACPKMQLQQNRAFIPCICRSACGLSIFLCLELSNFGWVAYFPATHVANQETSGSGFLFTASRSSDSMGYIWQAAVSGPCMTAPTLQSISLHQVRTVRIFLEISTRFHVLSTFPVVRDLGDLCGYALRLSPELWNFWELEPLNFLFVALYFSHVIEQSEIGVLRCSELRLDSFVEAWSASFWDALNSSSTRLLWAESGLWSWVRLSYGARIRHMCCFSQFQGQTSSWTWRTENQNGGKLTFP